MLDSNERLLHTLTLVKFHANFTRPQSRNRLISRTLGKTAVVSTDYNGVAPNDEEFWLCGFRRCIIPKGANAGIFVMSPIRAVDRLAINYIRAGYYTVEIEDGILYVIPRHKDLYWLMSVEDRKALLLPHPEAHSLIVVNYDVDLGVARENAKEGQTPLNADQRGFGW